MLILDELEQQYSNTKSRVYHFNNHGHKADNLQFIFFLVSKASFLCTVLLVCSLDVINVKSQITKVDKKNT